MEVKIRTPDICYEKNSGGKRSADLARELRKGRLTLPSCCFPQRGIRSHKSSQSYEIKLLVYPVLHITLGNCSLGSEAEQVISQQLLPEIL